MFPFVCCDGRRGGGIGMAAREEGAAAAGAPADEVGTASRVLRNASAAGTLGMVYGVVAASWSDRAMVRRGHLAQGLARLSGTVARNALLFASVSAVFTGTEGVMRAQRGVDDVWNGAAAGCVTGAAFSMARNSLPLAVGLCAAGAGTSVLFDLIKRLPSKNTAEQVARNRPF